MSSKKLYNCESCNKTFETATGLWKHKKNKHTEPKIIIDKNCICKYCNKDFYDRTSRWRHEKQTCKMNTDIVILNDPNSYNNIANKSNINKLAMDNSNIIDTQNNNQTINIYLNGTGKENIDELNEDEIEEILNDGLNSLITLIKHLNFNDRLPENHTFGFAIQNFELQTHRC